MKKMESKLAAGLLATVMVLFALGACSPSASAPPASPDDQAGPPDMQGEPPVAPGAVSGAGNLVSLRDTYTLAGTFSRMGWYSQADDGSDSLDYLWQFDGYETVDGQQVVKIIFTTTISGVPRYDGANVWLNSQGEAIRFELNDMIMDGEAAAGMFSSEWIGFEFLYGLHEDVIMQAIRGSMDDYVSQELVSTASEQVGGLTVDVTRTLYTIQQEFTVRYTVAVADFGDVQMIVELIVEAEAPDGRKDFLNTRVEQLERR